jgi:pfkB family carbohydrate kinase/Nucleoside 2-deoxyribosyltransferase
VIIVGGTYQEQVTVPEHQELAGSGLRAAACLGRNQVRLVTPMDGLTAPLAASVAAALGVTLDTVERDQPVGFRYFSPVMPPLIDGPSAAHVAALRADDETVLVFGTVETGPRDIRTRRLIVDPQRPRDLAELDLTGLQADATAIVANARETRALAGGITDLGQAARHLRGISGAFAVVVKDSARGCMVLTGDGDGILTRVGPYPTRSVWPLGSGDVFAAAYAHAWDHGAEPVEAARIASSSAAWWCGTRATIVPPQVLTGTPVDLVLSDASAELVVPDDDPLVYLAGPFFTLADRWLVENCRSILIGLGAQVFSPLHDVGPGGDEVASRDLEGLDRAQAVFALLDGWDPGTVYEVGWAHRKGLPVVGFLQGPSHEGTKMLVGAGAELHKDLSSALYRVVWAAQGQPLTPSRVTGRA